MQFVIIQIKDLSLRFWCVVLGITIVICCLTFYEKIGLLSLACTLSGVYYALLIGQRKVIGYGFGILYCICYIPITLKTKLYGDMFLTLFYLPLNFWGIYSWMKYQTLDQTKVQITTLPKKYILNYSIIFIIATSIYMYLLKILEANFIFLNSCSTIAQIFAFYFQIKRYVESYILVNFANIIWIFIWLDLTLQNQKYALQLIQVFVFFCIGICYFYKWKKELP